MANKIDLSLDEVMKVDEQPQINARQNNSATSSVNGEQYKRGRGRGVGRPRPQTLHKPNNANFRQSVNNTNSANARVTVGKLLVSNLDFRVTENDMMELFSEFGTIQRIIMREHESRPFGEAKIFFERKADALKALRHYIGVPLDGKKMRIRLLNKKLPTGRGRGRGRGGF